MAATVGQDNRRTGNRERGKQWEKKIELAKSEQERRYWFLIPFQFPNFRFPILATNYGPRTTDPNMDFPDNLRYTKEHEWVRPDEDGSTATIGITDFAQSELGDIVFVELEPVGSEIDADDTFGSVEAVKAASDLFMPLSGVITAHNETLESHPESVNNDPYGAGWMIKIELSNPSEVEGLLSAADYEALVG